MYPLGKPISQLTPEDLAQIRDKKYPENLNLDFKQSYDGGSELKSKRELLKDIVAMANTAGGVIIIGGVEQEDTSTGIKHLEDYITVPDASKLAEKYANWIREHTDDVLAGVDIIPFVVEGKSILLIEVPDSPHKPHRVDIKNEPKECYVRTGTSNIPMSMHMVKHMILSQGSYWADCKEWAERAFDNVDHQGPCWVMLVYPFDVRRSLFKSPDLSFLDDLFKPPRPYNLEEQRGPNFDEKGCYYRDEDVEIRFYRNGAYRLVMQKDSFTTLKQIPMGNTNKNCYIIDTSWIISWASYIGYIFPKIFMHLRAEIDGFVSARYLKTPEISQTVKAPVALDDHSDREITLKSEQFSPRDIILSDESFRSLSELNGAIREIIFSLFNAFGYLKVPDHLMAYFEEPWHHSRFMSLEKLYKK